MIQTPILAEAYYLFRIKKSGYEIEIKGSKTNFEIRLPLKAGMKVSEKNE